MLIGKNECHFYHHNLLGVRLRLDRQNLGLVIDYSPGTVSLGTDKSSEEDDDIGLFISVNT